MPCVTDGCMPGMQGGLRGHRKLLDVDANVVTKVKCTVRYKKECFKHHGPKMFKECNLYKARPAQHMSDQSAHVQEFSSHAHTHDPRGKAADQDAGIIPQCTQHH